MKPDWLELEEPECLDMEVTPKGLRFLRGSEVGAGPDTMEPLGSAVVRLIERIWHEVSIGGNCDSPIEVQLGAAIIMFFDRAGSPVKIAQSIDRRNAKDELLLVPQYRWGVYRSDFAIINPTKPAGLLIECDGHAFHSSEAAKAHDAKKDAAALERGFITMRFRGTQIYKDADGCAQKIWDAVSA